MDAQGRNSEKIRFMTSDYRFRELRIPSTDPSEQSVIFSAPDFQNIMFRAHVLTKERQQEALMAQCKAREEAMIAADKRLRLIKEMDLSRKKAQPLSDLEVEDKERNEYLLKKATELKLEEEEEIKQLNKLILFVQCQAERDTQIERKKEKLTVEKEEERMVDAMMKEEHQLALEEERNKNELCKKQRIQGKMCILKQIQEHQEDRILQDEKKAQEGERMLKNIERLKMEDLEVTKMRKEEQERLREDILNMIEESQTAKELKKEEERLINHNAMEYMRKKLEKRAELEAERNQKMREKEMELAKLRAHQERKQDEKAEKDVLRARRHQEAIEREWRRKEKEEAKKLVEQQEKLKADRLEQIIHQRKRMAVESGRQRAEFERILRLQKECIKAEEEKKQRKKQVDLCHVQELRQQIQEREARIAAHKKELLNNEEKRAEEAFIREKMLEAFKKKKLNELKATGIPMTYCSAVEKKTFCHRT